MLMGYKSPVGEEHVSHCGAAVLSLRRVADAGVRFPLNFFIFPSKPGINIVV